MGEEELGGPVADFVEHRHPQRVPATEEPGDITAPHGVRAADPGHVPLLRLAEFVGDAEPHDAEPFVGGVQLPHAAQHIGVHEQPVVVQFDDDVDITELPQPREGRVPPTGAPQVLVELDGGDLTGQGQPPGELGQRAAVADDHDPLGRHVLLGHGTEQRVDLLGPIAHRHHGDGDPGHPHVLTSSRSATDGSTGDAIRSR